MKKLFALLGVSLSLTVAFNASAAQSLLLDITITEQNSSGPRPTTTSMSSSLQIESGKQAIMQVGKSQIITVTPTLLKDGSVDIRAVLAERKGTQDTTLARPRIKAKLGEAAEISVGDYTFKAKVTKAK